jgi:predicted P-loop ATPase
VACGRIEADGVARDRDQLWAEAKARFDAGSV